MAGTPVPEVERPFKSATELRMLDASKGVTEGQVLVTYFSLVGEPCSIAWFVLTELLSYEAVENYDGSCTEWSNLMCAPNVTGESE